MHRLLMIHFSSYPGDVRPRREAETLVEAGMFVDTICLRKPGQKSQETISGVTAYRINIRRSRSSKLRYIWGYFYFALIVFFKTTILHFREKYDLIHVHNMPDFFVFCALIPRLSGAKILLDLHDPVPEIYMTKYEIPENHPAIKILSLIEKISVRFADHIITPNVAFRNLFIKRGCPPHKIDVVMNTPMEKIVTNSRTNRNELISVADEDFVIMYHGTITLRNGCLDLLNAVDEIRNEIPRLRLHMFGSGDSVELLKSRIEESGLSEFVKFHGHVPNEKIFDAIRVIHTGIIPNQMNPFTNLNFPVRIFEYLTLKKPVIVPKTKGILDYFDNDSIILFEPGNISSMAEAILNSYKFPEKLNEKINKGYYVYQKYTWQKQRRILEDITADLIKK